MLIILLIVVAIFAPLAAKAVQMAVSRQREYLADATSVQFTRNPNGLISALGKLADKAAALSRSESCHAASLHRQSGADLHQQIVGAAGHPSRHCGPHRSPAQSGRLASCPPPPSTCRAIAARRGHAPENTLAAFRAAVDLGVTTLETDLAITKDDVVVISHDPLLNPDLVRGPDGKWITAGPPIHSLTLAELKRYDIGRINPATKYAQQFPEQKPVDGERFPTLAELFAAAGPDVRFNIEIKTDPTKPDLTVDPGDLPSSPSRRSVSARRAGAARSSRSTGAA